MRSGVTRYCLKCMVMVPVDREIFTMIVIIGRIVAETCLRRKVGDRVKVTLFIRDECKILAISSIDAGGNDDKTLGVRGGLGYGGMGEMLDAN